MFVCGRTTFFVLINYLPKNHFLIVVNISYARVHLGNIEQESLITINQWIIIDHESFFHSFTLVNGMHAFYYDNITIISKEINHFTSLLLQYYLRETRCD